MRCADIADQPPWLTLIHAHDHIWKDKTRPLLERLAACEVLFERALMLSGLKK
jgi:hypothetical protein